jgi:hypothetical protein
LPAIFEKYTMDVFCPGILIEYVLNPQVLPE